MINGKAFTAAVLILLVGILVTSALMARYASDLVFYLTATRQPVLVERVSISETVVSDPVHATRSHDLDIALELDSAGGRRVALAHFSGSAQSAATHARSLRSMQGQRMDMYLSERAPHHYALELEFPVVRLGAILLTLLVLVAIPGLVTISYLRSAWRRVRHAP